MNTQGSTPWATKLPGRRRVASDTAVKRRAHLRAVRWGAGKALNLSPKEAAELATARRRARNKRKHASAPVQKRAVYAVHTRLRPLRDKIVRNAVAPRPWQLPSKRRVQVLLVHEVTKHDLAKHGMLPGFIRAATRAEAERIAVERCYREECAKALLARRAA